jgi:hypothetical protein
MAVDCSATAEDPRPSCCREGRQGDAAANAILGESRDDGGATGGLAPFPARTSIASVIDPRSSYRSPESPAAFILFGNFRS